MSEGQIGTCEDRADLDNWRS